MKSATLRVKFLSVVRGEVGLEGVDSDDKSPSVRFELLYYFWCFLDFIRNLFRKQIALHALSKPTPNISHIISSVAEPNPLQKL